MRTLGRELEHRLERVRLSGLYRSLEDAAPEAVDFCSNDYLDLSRDPRLRAFLIERLQEDAGSRPVSAPSSRLLRGNTPHHRLLEEKLARFKGTESALVFPSGYQANLGLLSALMGPRDRVVSDRLNHASIIDGIRLSGARKVIHPHRDLEAVRTALATPHSRGRTFLVTESLFSMDGDIAPLDQYADLAEEWGADLIVDDSHATGLFGGGRGSGLTEHFGIEKRTAAIVSGCGKGLGVAGAFVAGPRTVIDYLVNVSRSFIFTTSTPPLLLYALEGALGIIQDDPERRKRVLELSRRLRRQLRTQGMDTLDSAGPIVPVILGDNSRALSVAQRLREQGLDVRALRPPTVPAGTARLRISVHANHSPEQLDRLCRNLAEALETV